MNWYFRSRGLRSLFPQSSLKYTWSTMISLILSFIIDSVNAWYENVKCAGWHWGKPLKSIPIHCCIALDLDLPCLFLQTNEIIFWMNCSRCQLVQGCCLVFCIGDNAAHAAAEATAGIGIQVIPCLSLRRPCGASAVTWLTAGRAAFRSCWERRRYLWQQVARNTSRPTFRFDFDLQLLPIDWRESAPLTCRTL